jgi:hypothetical protein
LTLFKQQQGIQVKEIKGLMLGVGSDGRTSLLEFLKKSVTRNTHTPRVKPTATIGSRRNFVITKISGISMEVIHHKKTKIILCDCPGSSKMRSLWKVTPISGVFPIHLALFDGKKFYCVVGRFLYKSQVSFTNFWYVAMATNKF